jgi:hypothetical protein
MRQRCVGIVLLVAGAVACSSTPVGPTGQLTLTARNETSSDFLVYLVDPKAGQQPLLGPAPANGAVCFSIPSFGDSSYATVTNGAGFLNSNYFIPSQSTGWQLAIQPDTGSVIIVTVSTAVSCTPTP